MYVKDEYLYFKLLWSNSEIQSTQL